MQAPSIFIGEFYFCCFQPSFLLPLSPDNPDALELWPLSPTKTTPGTGSHTVAMPDFKGQTFKVTGILVLGVGHPLLALFLCLLCPHSIYLLKFSIQSL